MGPLRVPCRSTTLGPSGVENEVENISLDKEIPKERYISPEKRQKITDGLRLI